MFMEHPLPREQEQSRLHRALGSRKAEWVLAGIAVVESWFMPIVIEPFMALPILAHPAKWFRLTTIATIFSVLGGVLGYLTGLFFFDLVGHTLITLYGVESYVEKTTEAFNENAFWVIFAGAFSPLPYKIFTLIGGFLRIDFTVFLFASLVGRGLRFYAVGFILGRFGERALPIFLRHLNIALLIVLGGVFAYALFAILG